MAENEKLADQKLSEEELDNVAGGTRENFNDVCNALGKNPTFNTRDGIRKLLKDKWMIDVEHWNTGDWGSKKEAEAEFTDMSGCWSREAGASMTTKDVIRIIKQFPDGVKG